MPLFGYVWFHCHPYVMWRRLDRRRVVMLAREVEKEVQKRRKAVSRMKELVKGLLLLRVLKEGSRHGRLVSYSKALGKSMRLAHEWAKSWFSEP
ncbi:uncharacterized protein A4U43_C02F5380 [Asparagus officinalis]|uniref:Uncharacterized protein n=1 Tax=Asparagus officinalis TaxID=4686 RepID=A0A5P1FG29_ASPOF|nr:uncharacterized protein A4U43_C02F5380 [Asparagus officinalis]